MATIENHAYYHLEILKHVEQTPELNNRMAASKLGCSVKLAHEVLKKLVNRGLLHVKKQHSRKWDYFLTPSGIAEKARLTMEFLEFSMQFYQEARKSSSQLCKDLAQEGKKNIAFLGAGDLAEIVYLGVKEWGLNLKTTYDDNAESFLGNKVQPLSKLNPKKYDVVIVCLYNKTEPMKSSFLPNGIKKASNFYWAIV